MSEKGDRDPIEAPTSHPAHDATRALAEGVADFVPGASIVTGILRVTHPPKSEQARDEWQRAISARTNEHSERIDRHAALLEPTETVTGLAAQLLQILAQQCPDGLGYHHFEPDDLQSLLPDEKAQVIEDAVCDLEVLGLVLMRHTIGGWSVTLTQQFYEQVDHQVMGWNTVEDAVAIARLIIAESNGDVANLHKKMAWSKRRFNPALVHLLPLFPEGRISQVIQDDYPTDWLALEPEDRAALRRFVARFEQSTR